MPDDDRIFTLTQHYPEGFSAGARVFCCSTCSAVVLDLARHQLTHNDAAETAATVRTHGRMLFVHVPPDEIDAD